MMWGQRDSRFAKEVYDSGLCKVKQDLVYKASCWLFLPIFKKFIVPQIIHLYCTQEKSMLKFLSTEY